MKPKSYIEWLSIEEGELGLKILLSYTILKRIKDSAIDSAFNAVKASFKKAVFEKGVRVKSIEITGEDDVFMKGMELVVLADTVNGGTTEDYSGYIFHHAENLYEQVMKWENKSLLEYIKWWVKRKFK